MLQPPSRARAGLSHLVGPGPSGDAATFSVGVCNPGTAVAAVRVELELAYGNRPPFATGWWAGLVGRDAQRELTARIAWSRGELMLEERPFAFTGDARPGAGAALVARARLRGGPHDEAVLEVGLRAPAHTPRP